MKIAVIGVIGMLLLSACATKVQLTVRKPPTAAGVAEPPKEEPVKVAVGPVTVPVVPAVASKDVQVLDDFNTVPTNRDEWIREPWGTPPATGTAAYAGGRCRLDSTPGSDGKAAWSRVFPAGGIQLESADSVSLDLELSGAPYAGVALAVWSVTGYYESVEQHVASGSQTLRFPLSGRDFKCATSNWQHSASLEGLDHVAKLSLVFYSTNSLRIAIDNLRVIEGAKRDHRTPAPPAVPGVKAGTLRTVNLGGGEKLELAWCPPGEFLMGSPPGEPGREKNETPHRVTLTAGFWMGTCEVTQAQWERVMGYNPSLFKGATNPVETVSWEDCQEFVRKLNEFDGRASPGAGLFRLPTEAEWEYACRAGAAGPFAGELDAMGWHGGNSGKTTHAAGQKQPNAWGLYDMHGNVWEWCQDGYGRYPAGSVTNPAAASPAGLRLFRGGSWFDPAASCRAAYRYSSAPNFRLNFLGFRVALAPAE